jgi:hypothetical protein
MLLGPPIRIVLVCGKRGDITHASQLLDGFKAGFAPEIVTGNTATPRSSYLARLRRNTTAS